MEKTAAQKRLTKKYSCGIEDNKGGISDETMFMMLMEQLSKIKQRAQRIEATKGDEYSELSDGECLDLVYEIAAEMQKVNQ